MACPLCSTSYTGTCACECQTLRVHAIGMPEWFDDPSELADLWRWLADRCWPDDGCRPPEVPYFLENAHKWGDARNEMIAERRAA